MRGTEQGWEIFDKVMQIIFKSHKKSTASFTYLFIHPSLGCYIVIVSVLFTVLLRRYYTERDPFGTDGST